MSLLTAFAADQNLNAGIKHYEKREYNPALLNLKKVVSPDCKVTAMYYTALCHQQIGDRTTGDALLREIIKKYPHSSEADYAGQYFIAAASANEVASINRLTTPGSVSAAISSSSHATSTRALPDTCVVPFRRGTSGHMFVKVLFNGRPVEVMFDTGAEACLISRAQLNAAGVTFASTGIMTAVRGVGATALPAENVVFDIGLGDIVKKVPVLVVSNYNIEPLLGQSFFGDYRYQIDSAAGVIRLTRAGVAAASGGYDSINVPFTSFGKEMLVKAKVNGNECPMFFDTGAFTNLFPTHIWRSMGLSIPRDAVPMMTSGVGGNAVGYKFRVDRLELGAVSKSGVEVVVSDTAMPYPLLGQDFFRDKQFTIDSENHVIRFVH